MNKLNVVLVVLNKNALPNAIETLNFNNVNLLAILIEDGDGKAYQIGNMKIPAISFVSIKNVMNQAKNCLWLIAGPISNVSNLYSIKKFLRAGGVPEDNIVNFYVSQHISKSWIGNLRYTEENDVDYFSTGISYAEAGLNLRYIPGLKGVNLAISNQDLYQGYLTAQHVFKHAKPGTIKFVLIGLTPYSFRYDNIKSFSVCTRALQYVFTLENYTDDSRHGQLLKFLVSDNIKNIFASTTSKDANLNYESKVDNREIPVYSLITWEDELKNLTKDFRLETVEKNIQVLEDYIKLCLENGAKPIGFVFPFAPAMHDNYDAELLSSFRRTLNLMEKAYNFTFIDLFDLPLDYDCFYNMAHLNLKGSKMATSALAVRMAEKNLIPVENFNAISYDQLDTLSNILPKDQYNSFIDRVFKVSVEKIRKKNKIKVGFVGYDASMWCGDGIYNHFANDDRYETTMFLCLRRDKFNVPKVIEDFRYGVEQFKANGINVVGVSDDDTPIPKQDILIFLTPYIGTLSRDFQFTNLTAETLITYVPYAFNITDLNIFNDAIFHVAWKIFFETPMTLRTYDKFCRVGMPRGYYSGYPKIDYFFEDDKPSKFEWKMARPDAKKIIYAPHWSINCAINYATFQWNYKFMYEYAKAHPEISWVLKPHPNLLFSAVERGVFSDAQAFNEYLQKWNDLPNAKVETGAYYQDIFSTSDGIILDSGSFISEYQYTHKPMIFLTNDAQQFNEAGNELMKLLYRVDGRDFEGMAALMQKIFIEGKDEMFDARMNYFDRYLNYKKTNGMLASEFIFNSITKEIE